METTNVTINENSYMVRKAIRLVDKELKRGYDRLKAIEHKWNESLDLKLHGASNKAFDGIKWEENGAQVIIDGDTARDYFYQFCEIEYDAFVEYLKEGHGIEFDEIRDNIGRTSKFYLTTAHNNYSDYIKVAFAELSSEYNNTDLCFGQYSDTGIPFIDMEASLEYCEDYEDFVNCCLEFVDLFYDEIEDKCKEIETVYDYIEEFKNSQENNFVEFVIQSWRDTL